MERHTAKADDGPLGRGYGDSCGAAHGLELIGERWALLVVRELMLSPKRFTDLRAGLPGLSANVLTQRLEKLEAVGIVERRELPPPAGRAYALTPWGMEAEPVILELGRWAARSPLHDAGQDLSATSLVLSMRTMFRPEQAAGLSLVVAFRVGRETFRATVADGTLSVGPGTADGAAATFVGSAPAVAGALYAGRALADVLADGDLAVTGDVEAARSYLGLFSLPPKVGADAT